MAKIEPPLPGTELALLVGELAVIQTRLERHVENLNRWAKWARGANDLSYAAAYIEGADKIEVSINRLSRAARTLMGEDELDAKCENCGAELIDQDGPECEDCLDEQRND